MFTANPVENHAGNFWTVSCESSAEVLDVLVVHVLGDDGQGDLLQLRGCGELLHLARDVLTPPKTLHLGFFCRPGTGRDR